MELPAVLGSADREPVVLIVTGRTAVARIGGMASVTRHVATVERMHMAPIIVYPARMRALGAEIAGEVGDGVRCLPSDVFASGEYNAEDLVLVVAGDWYISSLTMMEFGNDTTGIAAARFDDRGRIVAPMARLPMKSIKSLIPDLAEKPSGELISEAAGVDAQIYPLDVLRCHRLSDSVAVERAEAKLFSSLGRRGRSWHVRFVQKYLSIPLTKRLASVRVTAAKITAVKFTLGLLAAASLLRHGYAAGMAGAAAFFFSRVLDSVAGELLSAAVDEDRNIQEKVGFAADIVILTVIPIALATRPESGAAGPALAVVTAIGIAASSLFTYRRILRRRWQPSGSLVTAAVDDDFPARFATPDGAAYGLLLAAAIGRLDLFLWASAIGSHLFYLLGSRSSVNSRS